jgi:predicted ATPase/DNA-binding CsgD family transcriptional regulator
MDHAGRSAVEVLTRRERDVLARLAQGQTAPEIAQSLTLGLSTVKFHLSNLYGKLGVNTRRQAISQAHALGLLPANGAPHPPPRGVFHNLPLPVTRFFGREAELAEITQRLAENRLVTLTGPGGVGKTRLALRVAEALLPEHSDGVWFVELAALSDPALVAQQTAATLGLRDQPGQPVIDGLARFLRERRSLIVLDNCEHLLEGCARLCDALLRVCPALRLLVCSREPLAVPGEAILVVPSLPVPSTDQPLSPDNLAAYPSVRLFVDRARLARADYQLAAHNAAAVAGICQRVDGIPLAIEMAAARINTLSAEQLAGRLEDAFRVLTSGSRTALPRQQTLRATIDWSYQLLSQPERLLLQRLSVFAGGCSLEAAEAVCSGEGLLAPQIVDTLASLVAKSMVVADRAPGEATRYHLLEMVRQFAREKLNEFGTAAGWHRRHRDHYLDFGEIIAHVVPTSEQLGFKPKLARELDNLRQALAWSFNVAADIAACARLLGVLGCGIGFRHAEALEWSLRCRAACQGRDDVPPTLHEQLLGCCAALTALDDPPAAVQLAVQAVELCRARVPEAKEALVCQLEGLAGLTMNDLGEPERAVALIEEADALRRELNQEADHPQDALAVRANAAGVRAVLANALRRYPDALAYSAVLIEHGKKSGADLCLASGHTLQGIASLGMGAFPAAREHFLVALDLNRKHQAWEIAYNLRWLGAVDLAEGNLARALAYCHESLVEADLIPDRNIIASNFGLLAAISARLGQTERSATFSGAAQALYARQRRKPWEDSSLDTLFPGWQSQPDHAALSAAFEAGQTMTSEEALAYALQSP